MLGFTFTGIEIHGVSLAYMYIDIEETSIAVSKALDDVRFTASNK